MFKPHKCVWCKCKPQAKLLFDRVALVNVMEYGLCRQKRMKLEQENEVITLQKNLYLFETHVTRAKINYLREITRTTKRIKKYYEKELTNKRKGPSIGSAAHNRLDILNRRKNSLLKGHALAVPM